VVIIGGAPYDLNKIKKNNHTIVWSWYNGSEGGNALADVLTGKVNPSGKLPFTFPVALDESPAHYLNTFPGDSLTASYKEGILVGYRWYDTKNIAPLYPFGYGLSYTTFEYSSLHTTRKSYKPGETITVTLNVRNTGKMDGKETVQLYIGKRGSVVERADKELKAFKKVMVPAGKEVSVSLSIPVNSLAYYDEKRSQWVVEPGDYQLMDGTSSKDIEATASIKIIGGK
jgi:beta-glucosidase